jgi:hypothetical protein
MIDTTAEREESLERISDIGFNLLGGHSIVKSGYQDHGNVDGRKHIHGHLHQSR